CGRRRRFACRRIVGRLAVDLVAVLTVPDPVGLPYLADPVPVVLVGRSGPAVLPCLVVLPDLADFDPVVGFAAVQPVLVDRVDLFAIAHPNAGAGNRDCLPAG